MTMYSGLNTKLKRWNASMSDWEPIGEVNSLTLDGITVETIEVNRLDPDNNYVNKLKGIINAGTFSANFGFNKELLKELKRDIEDDYNQNYAIVIPDDNETTLEMEGFPQELPMDFSSSDEITMDATFEIDGKPDIHDGGASSHSSGFGTGS